MSPDDGGTPWRPILLLLLIQFMEALTTYVFLPIVPFLAEHLQPDAGPMALGWATGQLTSFFYAGAIVGTPLWGFVSDRVGRRPILLLGLLLPQLCLVALALTPSLHWALALRLLQGLVGANASLTKTAMGEVCNQSSMAQGMSLLMLPFSIAQFIGPAAAGELANLATWSPWLDSPLLRHHPFLLTLALPLVVSLAVLPLLLVLLPETHPRAQANDQTSLLKEAKPLVQSGEDDRHGGLMAAIISPAGGLSILLYATAGGVFFAYLTLIPLWCKLDPARGGFGMDSRNVGRVMSSSGPVLFLTQPLLAPYLVKRWGPRRAWTFQSSLWALLLWLSPFAVQVEGRVGVLCVLWSLNNAVYQMLLSGCFIMLSNSAPTALRGTFVGVGTAAAAVVRLAMPVLAAPLFAYVVAEPLARPGSHHLVFNVLACVVACSAVLSVVVPSSVDHPWDTCQGCAEPDLQPCTVEKEWGLQS